MTILVLSTQREHVYINVNGLNNTDILSLLIKASKKRYYKIQGFYDNGDLTEEEQDIIKNQKRYFDNFESFLKW